MNIGDRVKVECEMKINQLEQSPGGYIVASGYIEVDGSVKDSQYTQGIIFGRVPLAACTLIKPGVTSILKEIYAK